MNLSSTIIPKADQLNCDDLLTGPRTITITAVDGGNGEQPVWIQYEGGTGRPWKPCKSMRRVLVAMWGAEGGAYVGRKLTLYGDPSVKFGGEAMGGIRISHASDIPATITMALTMTRGKRKPFTVEPLVTAKSESNEKPSRPMDELTSAGDIMVAQGMTIYEKWFRESLTQKERVMLKEKHPAWKEIAKVTT